jgi:hypothetical protein
MVVNGDGEDLFGLALADDIPIKLGHDLAGRGDAVEERLGAAAAALLLVQDRLAQVDALATDVNVAGPLDERTYVAVALAAEGAEGVLFRGARATTPSAQIFSCGHVVSFRPATASLPAAAWKSQLMLEGCRPARVNILWGVLVRMNRANINAWR